MAEPPPWCLALCPGQAGTLKRWQHWQRSAGLQNHSSTTRVLDQSSLTRAVMKRARVGRLRPTAESVGQP